MTGPSWSILTPTGAAGAVAGILLCADDAAGMDRLLRDCGAGDVRVGTVKLCRLLGVDQGLAARWTQTSAELMPHGGIAVVRALIALLESMGVREAATLPARAMYPEAGDEVEAEMLRALARARSPLAIDLIMEHAGRLRRGEAPIDASQARCLRRLVDPALVVALGPANVGKSTLVNQLAGRQVSIVADEPGTTRDHVGVLIEMAGVVVRYLDTPGIRQTSDPIEARAGELAKEMALGADLLLLCGDAAHPPAVPPALAACPGARLKICLRSDLGRPDWEADQVVSVREGRGIVDLVERIAGTLVPWEAREAGGAWRFWE